MSKNKLYTLGYFRKRLKDAGIESRILVNIYPETDNRKWTICIYKDLNVFCTCMKPVKQELGNEFFFSDLGQKIKQLNFSIKTDSLNVIIDYLKSVKEIDYSTKIETVLSEKATSEIVERFAKEAVSTYE